MKKAKRARSLKQALKDFHVTIFGSARIKKGDKEYEDVYNLAKIIGERGISLVTGGGPGVMRAANTGHIAGSQKTKAYTVGLGISLPHEQRIDPYVDIKKKFTRFSERLDKFMLLSNVIVVAPGGIGTMLELFFAWQLMQVKHISGIPIILLGEQWKGLLQWLRKTPLKRRFFSKEDLKLLFYAKNYNEAMEIINVSYEESKKGNKNFCLNCNKRRFY